MRESKPPPQGGHVRFPNDVPPPPRLPGLISRRTDPGRSALQDTHPPTLTRYTLHCVLVLATNHHTYHALCSHTEAAVMSIAPDDGLTI